MTATQLWDTEDQFGPITVHVRYNRYPASCAWHACTTFGPHYFVAHQHEASTTRVTSRWCSQHLEDYLDDLWTAATDGTL